MNDYEKARELCIQEIGRSLSDNLHALFLAAHRADAMNLQYVRNGIDILVNTALISTYDISRKVSQKQALEFVPMGEIVN